MLSVLALVMSMLNPTNQTYFVLRYAVMPEFRYPIWIAFPVVYFIYIGNAQNFRLMFSCSNVQHLCTVHEPNTHTHRGGTTVYL